MTSAVATRPSAAAAIEGIRAAGGTATVIEVAVHDFRRLAQVLSADDLSEVTSTILRRLERHARHRLDHVERTGGGEWLLVIDAPDQRIVDAELELDTTSSVRVPDAGHVRVALTIGVVADEGLGRTADGLVHDARAALLHAERRGAGFVARFDESFQTELAEQHDLEQALPRALDCGELVTYLQPIVRTSDLAIVGAEALVRWEHPDLGLLAPGRFLGVAERTGAIVEVGHQVLRAALAEARAWPTLDDGQPRFVSVNIASRQLADPTFTMRVRDTLDELGVDPSQLCLEVLEDTAQADLTGGRRALDDLQADGCRVAIDDFGTGWSSFRRLQTCPIDALKLDRCFVQGSEHPGVERAILDAVVGIGNELGIPVVAEGIENASMLRSVTNQGVAFAQGYFLGRPRPPEVLAEKLATGGHITNLPEIES